MSLRLLAAPTVLIASAAAGTALACSCIGYPDAATQLAEARLMVVPTATGSQARQTVDGARA